MNQDRTRTLWEKSRLPLLGLVIVLIVVVPVILLQGLSRANQEAADAWPITAATFIMMQAKQDKPEAAAASLKFFDWMYANGDQMASELDYVPMPADVKAVITESWANIQDNSGKAIAYK